MLWLEAFLRLALTKNEEQGQYNKFKEAAMKEVIYLDLFFLWNVLMDAVSLAVAGMIASEKAKLWRLFAASVFGAVVSLLILPFGPFLTLLAGFLSFLPMVLIAYGVKPLRRLGLISLFVFLSSLFLGGALEALSSYAGKRGGGLGFGVTLAALFFVFGAYRLWGMGLKRKLETRVISLSIRYRERESQFYGLVDSGCFLRDPESGDPVILLKAEYAADLLSPEELFSMRCGNGEGAVPIPVRTASGQGLMFAFSPERVRLHRKTEKKKREERVLVALDFSGGGFAGCPCLIPLSIV